VAISQRAVAEILTHQCARERTAAEQGRVVDQHLSRAKGEVIPTLPYLLH
jgi:hypothetical protein